MSVIVNGKTVSNDEFQRMVANNEVSAGPGGQAAQNALTTGKYDPNTNAHEPGWSPNPGENAPQQGQQTTAATAANNMQAPDYGKAWGVPNTSPLSEADQRNENVYGYRPNDRPQDWAKRTFAQGTSEFNPGLNPYLSQNPNANSPFNNWFQQKYGISAPTNALVGSLISNGNLTGTGMKGSIQGQFQGGGFGPTTLQGAGGNLQAVAQMMQQFASGNKAGLSAVQQGVLGQMMEDPSLAAQMVTSQLSGASGGWGMNYLGNKMRDLSQSYYDDPSNNGPEKKGQFFMQLLKMLGMG